MTTGAGREGRGDDPRTYTRPMRHLKRSPIVATVSIALLLAGASTFAASAFASSSASCKGISFTVLHNDHSGGVTLPHGQYNITSPNISCSGASSFFKTFLNKYNGKIPGWTGKQFKPGYGKYSKNKSKLNFTVKLTKLGATASCKGISFTVLHNDHSGGVTLPAGQYNITSPNLSCSSGQQLLQDLPQQVQREDPRLDRQAIQTRLR